MPKMLYVEFDLFEMEGVITALKRHFEVVVADSAAAAIERLEAEKFDLMLFEPGIAIGLDDRHAAEFWQDRCPGITVLLALRQGDFAPAGNPADLPVVVLTIYGELEPEFKVAKAYSQAQFTKPERMSTIIEACQSVLAR